MQGGRARGRRASVSPLAAAVLLLGCAALVAGKQLGPNGAASPVRAATWGVCGGINGPGHTDAPGAACPDHCECIRINT
jgi:hypothetical protein